jgi:cell surface protein SprA
LKTANQKSYFKRLFFVVLFLNSSSALFAQEPVTVRDSTSTTFSFGKLDTPDPASIESKYTYDPLTDRYIYTSTVGNFNINYPVILTPKEFQDLVVKESLKTYYKEKVDALDGKKDGSEEAKKNLIPDLYINSKFFETIFGSNVISVIPQGSVEMDLGVMYTKQENPAFSPRNQSNFTFDFDQRISLGLTGKVGTRLNVNANYDTQSTFDFQNLFKIEYTPLSKAEGLINSGKQLASDPTSAGKGLAQKELNKLNSDNDDSILQKLELGNVSMPLNSSLITGAQSLFGVKTELQFGKTRVTAVFSEQQSETRSVTAQGGGTVVFF